MHWLLRQLIFRASSRPRPAIGAFNSRGARPEVSSRLAFGSTHCIAQVAVFTTWAMTAPSLAQIFKEEKVPEAIASLLSSQLTVHSFPCICEGVESLEECLHTVLDTGGRSQLTPVSLACIKASYHRCIASVMASTSTTPGAAPTSSQSLAAAPSTWTETFPAKLSVERVKTMREAFEAAYPSEILDASSMPSSRLLASCNKQVQDKHYSYIAWKFRLSEEKQEEISASRPKKIARLDDFLFDDIPSREIADSGVSQMFLAHLLDLIAFAFCLLEVAHLSSFRAYSKLFIKLAFQRPSAESGLRSPNVAEMQAADKEAWKSICELVNKGWSIDDALHEIVQVRCILQSLLQPRVMVHKPKRPSLGNTPGGFPDRPGGKGGKGRGKDKGGKTRPGKDNKGMKWMVTFYENGQQKQVCKRWNLRSGCKLDDCAFVHCCAVDVGGKPCGKDHPAYMHVS